MMHYIYLHNHIIYSIRKNEVSILIIDDPGYDVEQADLIRFHDNISSVLVMVNYCKKYNKLDDAITSENKNLKIAIDEGDILNDIKIIGSIHHNDKVLCMNISNI